MTSEQLAAHLRVDRYGDFVLTDAIRPAPHLPVTPQEGFRINVYRDACAGLTVPVLAAAVSKEKLFDLFLDLLDPLGEVVDLVLETSHASEGGTHRDLFREHIDLPVLQSCFLDFEDLLLNDGCAGAAVISTTAPMEVQFDEHKLLVVYARDLEPFEPPAPARRGPHRRPEAHHRRRAPAQHRPAPRRRVRPALLPHRRRRTRRARQSGVGRHLTAENAEGGGGKTKRRFAFIFPPRPLRSLR